MASSISSGLKSADAAIAVGVNRVNSVELFSNGTDACSVVLYDNSAAASGTVLAKVTIGAASLKTTEQVVFMNPVRAENGIYADVTGTGAGYIVHYGG